MKKLLFVYNPLAGKGTIVTNVAKILDEFVKAGYLPTAYPTQAPKDGYNMILEHAIEYDMVVCSGGDGTLDETVTAMMGIAPEKRVPIGYIPAGSTNDFAQSLEIPKDQIEAAFVAVKGCPFRCDIGLFNNDVFVYVAAFGSFAEVSYETSQDVKNILGHTAYVLEGMKRLRSMPSYEMTVFADDTTITGDFIVGMVTNSCSIGGMKSLLTKEVSFDDGLFELTLIRKPKNIMHLQDIITAIMTHKEESEYVYSLQAKNIRVETKQPVSWTLDGEFGGQHTTVEIENKMKELEIMADWEWVEKYHAK